MRKRVLLILAVFVSLPGWTIRNLGTLPGGGLSVALGVNDRGEVVGQAQNAAGIMRAVMWDASGAIHEIPTPAIAGRVSSAEDINNSGSVTGSFGTATSDAHAFTWWLGGSLTDLGASAQSRGSAINNRNDVAGQWVVTTASGDAKYAVVWSGGTPGSPRNLGGFGGRLDYASDIADAPVVVGTTALASPVYARAFLWVDGSMRSLGTLGGDNSHAYGVVASFWPDPSETGLYVVGTSEVTPGVTSKYHAFVYSRGTLTDIGALLGCTQSVAYAINRSRDVVGWAGCSGDSRAWLYRGGAMINLLDVVGGPKSGWEQLQGAYDVNTAGQIAGYGVFGDGTTRAFLMTP